MAGTAHWTAVKQGRDRWAVLFICPFPKEVEVLARGRRSLERKVQRMHEHAMRVSQDEKQLVCLGVIE